MQVRAHEGGRAWAEQPGLSFAVLLRQLRAEAQLTQEELAEAASLSPRSVSDMRHNLWAFLWAVTCGVEPGHGQQWDQPRESANCSGFSRLRKSVPRRSPPGTLAAERENR
jgi:hypothetical protein